MYSCSSFHGPISSIIRISCRCEPNPTGPASEATYQDTSSPFHPDPADAIIIFNLFVQEDQNAIQVHLHAFTLVVHRSALLEKLLSSPLPTNAEVISSGHEAPERSPPELPWHIWGPPICRWFNSSFMATRWITTTCGQRVLIDEEGLIGLKLDEFGNNIREIVVHKPSSNI
ncbi:hypothetical protein A0H81_02071 [Grifola frondosa]|uniref:Uncharacterized protein n=1 Tax=Grifola frondosa TaxID=5627 RepID=A0A1C7MM72_GRIFR|nr:hypothetical protein A0H81_02071 [Grifola frondosa]